MCPPSTPISAAIFPNFGCSRSQRHILWMFANLFANGVDLRYGAIDRFRSSNLDRNPNRKENRAEPAFFHAWDIDAPAGAAFIDIEFAVEKPLRRVVVRVHDNG